MKTNKKILMPAVSAKAKKGMLCATPLKNGDKIKKGDVIAEIETDKVVIEIESEFDGVFSYYHFEEGDEINVGDAVAEVEVTE